MQCIVEVYCGGVTIADRFVKRPQSAEKKDDKSAVMTLRLDKELQEEFYRLTAKSDRSGNELMCMVIQDALEHLEFISGSEYGYK